LIGFSAFNKSIHLDLALAIIGIIAFAGAGRGGKESFQTSFS
jgi:hypothetical protein